MNEISNLTARQLQIIKRILADDSAKIMLQQLSEIHRVSTRQLHYDLDMIEYHLKKQNLELVKSRIEGIKITGDAKTIAALFSTVKTQSANIDFPCLIAIELLLQAKTSVAKLADELLVSRNKLIAALPEVEKLLATAGLILARKPSIGMQIIGDEQQIRMAKFKLNPVISEELEDYFAKKLLQFQVAEITNAIASYQRATEVGFSDKGIKELILILCYQQLRISQGYNVTYDFNTTKEAILAEDFAIIKTCFEQNGLRLTVEEIVFVLLQIRNTQVVYLPDAKKDSVENDEVGKLTTDFALLVSERLGLDFMSNGRFLNGLKLHLSVAMHRLRSGQVIKNPLTESVKYKYRFIFETCKQIIMQLEGAHGLDFPDDEIAYIAMHVGACFEMAYQAGYQPTALVVCNSGLATSNLLATRLKVMLPELNILGPMALSELKKSENLLDQVDFIISTINFSLTDKNVIVVSPLLGLDDVLLLKKRVINIASKKQLSYLITDTQTITLQLGDLLNANAITLQAHVTNWPTAIEEAARPLLAAGNITMKYIKAMIEAVENFGPYMVFIPEIAIIHAAPSAGVIKEGLSVLTLDKQLILGDNSGVPVRCFIVLATAEKESQLFMNLISLLDNEANVTQLLNSETVADVLQISNN